MSRNRRFGQFAEREEGSVLLEVALSTAVLLMLLLGCLQFFLALYKYMNTAYITRAAARYAMVRGSTWQGTPCSQTTTVNCSATSSDIAAFALTQSLSPMAAADQVSISVTWPGTGPGGTSCGAGGPANSPGCTVQVSSTFQMRLAIPFWGSQTKLLGSTVTAVISQ